MWCIRIEGDEGFLVALSARYARSELTIAAEGESYLLSSTHLEKLPSNLMVYETGESLIEYLNASSKIVNAQHLPLKSNGYFEIINDGRFVYRFHALGGISLPIKLSVVSNGLPAQDFVEIYMRCDRVKFVLTEFNKISLDWFEFFNIHEAVFSDSDVCEIFGSTQKAVELWSSKQDNSRFLGTANWYRHSKFGRTGGRSSRPPTNPMSTSEAENFIRRIVLAWLNLKLEVLRRDDGNRSY